MALSACSGSLRPTPVDIYYVRQEDDYARPGNLNVVGVTLRTRF